MKHTITKPRLRWTGRWWEIKWQPRVGITNTWGGHTFREACEFALYLVSTNAPSTYVS